MSKEFHTFTPASELKKQFRVSGHFYDMAVDGTLQSCQMSQSGHASLFCRISVELTEVE
ncbi:MAG: hypothetical protein ABF320_03785 [Lentimonas sp.]